MIDKIMIDKIKDEVTSWFIADENGFTNTKHFVIFMATITFPLVVFEGIKIGIYDKYSPTNIGLTNMMEGLVTPFNEVMRIKEKNSFGANTGTLNFSFVLLLFLIWGFAFLSIFISVEMREKVKKNIHKRVWANIKKFNTEMAFPRNEPGARDPDPEKDKGEIGNMILSDQARYDLAGTPNTYSCSLVVGSIGSGKSFTYVKPNILQMNSSYVVTDPSGELAQSLGTALMDHGYDVRVFNLVEQQYSCKYNPFNYIRCKKDVITTVNAFLNAATESENGGDPFFPIAEKNFYYALFYYVYTMCPKEEQTFKSVYELYASADEVESYGQQKGEVLEAEFDKKFREAAEKDPTNPCLSFYKTFKKGSPKTKQSILISAGVKLWFMSVETIANLLSDDELHLENIGDRKTALFVIIPTEDDSFKCISAMLFTQLFQILYYVGGTLNPQTYLLKKDDTVALRSKTFIKGTPSEQEAKQELINKREWFKNAFIEEDKELMKNDEELRNYFSTVNEENVIPWPMCRIIVPIDIIGAPVDKNNPPFPISRDGKHYILEEFKSKRAAELVLDAAVNGEIVQGKIKHSSHVRFMLDEFYNIGKIEGFEKKIATFRKYGISADIIVQSMSQLNMMYNDKPDLVTSCCDIKICLGVNTPEDAKQFSEMCGKSSYSKENKNYDAKGSLIGSQTKGGGISEDNLNLIEPEDVSGYGMSDKTIVVVRTQNPIKDKKYKATEHPRWKETFSDRDPSTADREFQYRRIFCIKQEDKNLIRTYIEAPNTNLPDPAANVTKQIPKSSRVKQGLDPSKANEIIAQRKKHSQDIGIDKSNKRFEALKQSKIGASENVTNYADESDNIPLFKVPKELQEEMAKGISDGSWTYDEITHFVSKNETSIVPNTWNQQMESRNEEMNGSNYDSNALSANMWGQEIAPTNTANNDSDTNETENSADFMADSIADLIDDI